MNKTKRFITSFLFIGFCALSSCYAATKNYTEFEIVHVWEQGSNFYILYDKKTSLYNYSARNMDGKLIKETVERGYQRIAASRIKNGLEIDLKSGRLIKDLVYIDDDFLVYTKNRNVFVQTKSQKLSTACDWNLWGSTNALRLTSEVFYCGSFFSAVGLGHRALSSKVVGLLESSPVFGQRGNVESTFAIASIVGAGENVLIFPFDDGMEAGNLTSLSIDAVDSRVESKSYPFDRRIYRWTSSREAYFSNGALISRRDDAADPFGVTACHVEDCKFVPFPDVFSYLFIRRSNNSAVFLTTKRIGSPKIRVRLLDSVL